MLVLFIVFNVIVTLVSSQSTTVSPSSSTSSTPVNGWQDVFNMAIRGLSEFSRVCIVASGRDYRIDVSPSFTYIQYSSYKAVLTQATDVVDKAYRNTETSMSRVNMVISSLSSQMSMIENILTQASPAERKILLPSSINSIARSLTDVNSVIGKISAEFVTVVAFFEELLRAVQPTPPSSTTPNPSGSTSTQANQSPLDINHPVAISNIITYFKSLIDAWNRVAAFSSKAATQATGVLQFVNNVNALLKALGDVDDAADFLKSLADLYTTRSTKIFTPRTITLGSYLILGSESERLAEVTTVNQREASNIPLTAKYFTELTNFHEANAQERNERYNNILASTPSR